MNSTEPNTAAQRAAGAQPISRPALDIQAPLRLEGQHVRLEVLQETHLDGLVDAVHDGELWKLWFTSVPSPEGMQAEIGRRLRLRREGSMLPFTVIAQGTGKVVGMTTYMNVDAPNRHVEIGSTWYAQGAQRTPLNTECKRLLLGHAFEYWDCIAVEFRTHWFNQRSRAAIERLGAKLDGVLRNHQLGKDGTLRDTCVYSIVRDEWPAVRMHLDSQLER